MYEAFYGLRERPFEQMPNPRFLFMTPQHREALTTLEFVAGVALDCRLVDAPMVLEACRDFDFAPMVDAANETPVHRAAPVVDEPNQILSRGTIPEPGSLSRPSTADEPPVGAEEGSVDQMMKGRCA